MFDTGNDQLSNELLAQLSARGNPRAYGRGDVLIEEGEQSELLLSGDECAKPSRVVPVSVRDVPRERLLRRL